MAWQIKIVSLDNKALLSNREKYGDRMNWLWAAGCGGGGSSLLQVCKHACSLLQYKTKKKKKYQGSGEKK